MENTVEQLIAERSYRSLNAEEKLLVSELCANEEEFNRMKQFFASVSGIAATESFEPSPGLKNSLNSVFAAKHGGIGARFQPREITVRPEAKTIPLYRQAWVRAAAGVVLVAGVFSIWKLSDGDDFHTAKPQPQIARNETEKKSAVLPQQEPAGRLSDNTAQQPAAALENPVRNVTQPAPVLYSDMPAGRSEISSWHAVTAESNSSAETTSLSYSTSNLSDRAFGYTYEIADAKLADLDAGTSEDSGTLQQNTSAVSASQEDLLSYIVPAF